MFKFETNMNAVTPAYGQLKVMGTQLCDADGHAIVLKGMSSHELLHFGQYMNSSSINYIKNNWGANIVRAAMRTTDNSYITNPGVSKAIVKDVVAAALEAGIYVIIDWHILSDGDPNTYKEEAKEFFKEMAKTYGMYPNIIYEICNEPNGVTWENEIKPYADYIIPAIRAIDPNNIIIVGTGNWCQDIDLPACDPLSYPNIMYACHFYSGTHTQWLRDKVDIAISKGLPVFVTEFGVSDNTGNGGPYLEESQIWMNYMKTNKISWVNWSLCDKAETSAALKTGASINGDWKDSDLTESGRFVKMNMGSLSVE